MRDVCSTLLARNGAVTDDCLVYIQITRGAAPRTHAFPRTAVAPTVYATLMPIVPRGDPAAGIAVITTPDLRWARCDIKSVALLPNCLANQHAKDAGATEAIFVRDGVALEGTATTFFGVFNGAVRTAPANNYILPGVTREAVLELCRAAGIPAREEPIFAHELPRADELFLSGTTVEVMPIVQVDGDPVADGRPGPIARRLLEAFHATTIGRVLADGSCRS
jgi:D-alanine transaminase